MTGFPDKSRRTALCGVLTAGSLALLYLSCLAPSGRFGLNAAAGLFPAAAVLVSGRSAGYLCWAAASVLGLILLPDKGIALLFLVFFGIYPVLKSRFETFPGRALTWGCKLVYFNLVLAALWFFLRDMFLSGVEETTSVGPVFLLGNFVFLAYDIGLSKLIFSLFRRLNRTRDS